MDASQRSSSACAAQKEIFKGKEILKRASRMHFFLKVSIKDSKSFSSCAFAKERS